MPQLAILIISSLLNALLGFIVFSKNYKSATNRYFALLNVSFITWSIANYFSTHPVLFSQLVWIRLVLFFAAFLCLSAFLTFTVFPATTANVWGRAERAALACTLVVMGLTLTPTVFASLKVDDGRVSPVPGPGIALLALLVVSLLGGGVWNLAVKYRRSTGVQKAQLKFILFGLGGAFGLILVTNFAFVVFLRNSSLIPLGSAYTLIFSSALYYAIIKHRLFDIQAAVARFVAYVLALVVLAAAYAIGAFVISTLLLGPHATRMQTQLTYMVLALLLSTSLQPIKKVFDRLTSRLFYQDAYNTQAFLDQLNRALVANNELEGLLDACSQIIASNMKLRYCLFGIRESRFKGIRIIGTAKKDFSAAEVLAARHTTPHLGTNVIMTDFLPPEASKLKQVLIKNDIAALVRLVPEFASNQEGLGYIILGQKRSGSMYTSQDIQVLGIIANELVIAIQNALHFEEIQAFNVTLQERINNATRKLRNTNERLKLLDETKDDFISMASHQLRTPLTSVKGYISLVLDGDAGAIKPNQRKLLTQAFISSQRMVYLIADLLNVSRLRTGKFIIEPTPINLADVVQEEVNQLVETAAGRSLQLTYHKPAHFPILNLDETKIRQVIMNFADNAIYYTPAGGHIEIRLTETPKAVELRVVDDGIGVPREEQHHLFTKFYRAKNAQKARPDGTGLGLFMAQKVVVGQGGAIIFNSKEGKGSTFGFTFPKDKLQVPSTPENKPA